MRPKARLFILARSGQGKAGRAVRRPVGTSIPKPESMSDTTPHERPASGGSVDADEVARFSALAERWWDPAGDLRPLHQLNPVRIAFVRDRLARENGTDPLAPRPLAGLRLLDVGCGGGLVAEPMARLGAAVVGIDAAERNVGAARAHAAASALSIDYRCATAEALAEKGETFDAVLALEIVEHVADRAVFFDALARLLRPGGLLFVATLNRTPRAFALAIVGAEYLLGWLPRGTHRWSKFLRPSELAAELRRREVAVAELVGVSYHPVSGAWRTSRDLSVNYMASARKAAA